MVARRPGKGTSFREQRTPEVVAKWAAAVRLRTAGAGYADIARQLGYHDASGAHQAVRKGLRESLRSSGSEDLRSIEAERLDRMQLGIWTKATSTHTVLDRNNVAVEVGPDPDAIAVVLKIMDRRAKLLGLDAPQRHQVETLIARVDREAQRNMVSSPRALELACDLDAELIHGTAEGHDPGGIRPLDQ